MPQNLIFQMKTHRRLKSVYLWGTSESVSRYFIIKNWSFTFNLTVLPQKNCKNKKKITNKIKNEMDEPDFMFYFTISMEIFSKEVKLKYVNESIHLLWVFFYLLAIFIKFKCFLKVYDDNISVETSKCNFFSTKWFHFHFASFSVHLKTNIRITNKIWQFWKFRVWFGQ